MNRRVAAWQLVLLVAILCCGAVWAVVWYRGRWISNADLLRRMPVENALLVYIDFGQLRSAGVLTLLDGAKPARDPEYESFVRRTQFDYRHDLDAALVAFTQTGRYIFARGRFDWKSIRSYVEAESGHCNNAFCRVPGSAPERHISFFPVQSGLMAMAVSPDDSAAWRLSVVSSVAPESPEGPVWISIPPGMLKSREGLPQGTHLFAGALENAGSVTIALAPESGRYAARLNVRCRNPQEASEAAAQLTRLTDVVRQVIQHEHQSPNPADLSGVLAAGSFRSEGARVIGYWPIERAFVQNILSGD